MLSLHPDASEADLEQKGVKGHDYTHKRFLSVLVADIVCNRL